METAMSQNARISLPDWPPQRLVEEAVLSGGLRHPGQSLLDAESSPWPLVRGAVLALLRHQCTDFDERLRARCEYDAEFRDALASQVAAAAFKKYRWLREDPRPFVEEPRESALPFDLISKRLADLHGLRDHLLSAIRDLKRLGNHHAEIAALQEKLGKTRAEIEKRFSFLTEPRVVTDSLGKKSRTITLFHDEDEIGGYFFHTDKEITPNRIEYLGFRCAHCQARVARWKQIISLGQGFRCVVFSCHHMSSAVFCPPGGPAWLKPMTVTRWGEKHAGLTAQRRNTHDVSMSSL
jgi:hypothetical protein